MSHTEWKLTLRALWALLLSVRAAGHLLTAQRESGRGHWSHVRPHSCPEECGAGHGLLAGQHMPCVLSDLITSCLPQNQGLGTPWRAKPTAIDRHVPLCFVSWGQLASPRVNSKVVAFLSSGPLWSELLPSKILYVLVFTFRFTTAKMREGGGIL